MRAVLQRVTSARVEVGGQVTGEIQNGLVILLGIHRSDTTAEADALLRKILGLRIFDDAAGKMNLSVSDTGGSLLIVSQFTLYGSTRKGMRPSFDQAARPEAAKTIYDYFVLQAASSGIPVQSGVFQASMQVSLVNDGPVTILCESDSRPEVCDAEAKWQS